MNHYKLFKRIGSTIVGIIFVFILFVFIKASLTLVPQWCSITLIVLCMISIVQSVSQAIWRFVRKRRKTKAAIDESNPSK